jgi:hypothetical protein
MYAVRFALQQACGSKAASPSFYFSENSPHKNGIAKVLRHATAQSRQKTTA